MMTFDWPEPMLEWDLMKWKAETQAEILQETAEMTREEVREYFRQAGERFDKERERRTKA